MARSRQHRSNADRQKAYRQRRQQQTQEVNMESADIMNRGQVEIGGAVYEVKPSVEAYEVSKRVYRMLCDYPSKLTRFDDLLRQCGMEIKDQLRQQKERQDVSA